MNSTPQLPGYKLDQRLLEHPLAEIWRGRSFTGMEVVALILSDSGAADEAVRERLVRASRTAALGPEEQQTPLWAANLTATRPYAVTQLVPGQSGAERLLDPLDGLLGNDEESLGAVRSQLAQYGAAPVPAAFNAQHVKPSDGQQGDEQSSHPPQHLAPSSTARSALGRWTIPVVILAVLITFSALYSAGTKIGTATKEQRPTGPAPVAPVSPAPLPSPAILPGIPKPSSAPYLPPVPALGLIGATYTRGADVQQVQGLGLPFVFGWPRPPSTDELGASATTIYRRVTAESTGGVISMEAKIALRPCTTLAACLTDRAAFDQEWTKTFRAPVPATAKDANTWLTVREQKPYTLTMTHAFASEGRYWLVGVAVAATAGEEPAAQRVLNDIWRQTQ
ncbi:hypothetical protein [Kribbella catacumbae]|uniref:hypothetical protein n=1 Tax=Kribbella catacumbae TaxID=460086 RepID=UPI000373D912|nr:hypothetical protein [Kribbella catacumbae]